MKRTIYTTRDGENFPAETALEFLHALRGASFNPEKTLEGYMEATAKAAQLQTGAPHRWDTPDNLVDDLKASGLVTCNNPYA